MKHLNVGDKVKYSRDFLRSTGMLTGVIPVARGEIVSLEDFGEGKLVTIDWNFIGVPKKVLSCNLVKVGEVEIV